MLWVLFNGSNIKEIFYKFESFLYLLNERMQDHFSTWCILFICIVYSFNSTGNSMLSFTFSSFVIWINDLSVFTEELFHLLVGRRHKGVLHVFDNERKILFHFKNRNCWSNQTIMSIMTFISIQVIAICSSVWL